MQPSILIVSFPRSGSSLLAWLVGAMVTDFQFPGSEFTAGHAHRYYPHSADDNAIEWMTGLENEEHYKQIANLLHCYEHGWILKDVGNHFHIANYLRNEDTDLTILRLNRSYADIAYSIQDRYDAEAWLFEHTPYAVDKTDYTQMIQAMHWIAELGYMGINHPNIIDVYYDNIIFDTQYLPTILAKQGYQVNPVNYLHSQFAQKRTQTLAKRSTQIWSEMNARDLQMRNRPVALSKRLIA